jgi:TetR/AcrR family transcriptional regulator, transcriptional repressor for nem operon
MARIVKDPLERRSEILDAAQKLIYTRGYEQMTIQDILDGLHISKGAFYHYFDSKQALLEALTARLMDEAVDILAPIRDDPGRNAIEKLNAYFDTGMRWKTAQKDYMLALLRGWYSDDNAIVRQKLITEGYSHITPFIESILVQGVEEGLLSTPYPRQTAQVVIAVMTNMGDAMAGMLMTCPPGCVDMEQVDAMVKAYTGGLERMLGAAEGSFKLIDMESIKEWFVAFDGINFGSR